MIDKISVGDILFTTEGKQREVIFISDQDVLYPIVTVTPTSHDSVQTYTKDGLFLHSNAASDSLLSPVVRGSLLESIPEDDGSFLIVLVTNYKSHDADTFHGTVVFSSEDKDEGGHVIGDHSTIWVKTLFFEYGGVLRIRG